MAIILVFGALAPVGQISAAPVLPACSLSYIEQVEAKVFAKTNYERTSRGLPAFKPMASVSAVARSWSQFLAENELYYHNPDRDAQSPEGFYSGENIHRLSVYNVFMGGYVCDAEAMATKLVVDWMNSPGHRSNILNSNLQYLGVGAWIGEDDLLYATQILAYYYSDQASPPPNGTITNAPTLGPSGTVVTVTGGGYMRGERVDIRWGSPTGKIIGYVTTDSRGSFTGKVTVPPSTLAVHQIYGIGTTSGITDTTTFQVTGTSTAASSSVSPSQGQGLTVPTVSGSGYRSGEVVEVKWGGANGRVIARVTASAEGRFTARITVPDVAPGSYQVYSHGRTSNTATITVFRVTSSAGASVAITPASGVAGSVVAVQGTGMRPGERVNIRWSSPSGSLLGYVTARADGSYSGRITVPKVATGNYTVYASGATSDRVSTTTFRITAAAATMTTRSSISPMGTPVPVASPTATVRATPAASEPMASPTAAVDLEPTAPSTPVPTDESLPVSGEPTPTEPAPTEVAEVNPGSALIYVTDSNGEAMAGACAGIHAPDGTLLETICDATADGLDDGVIRLDGLPAGTYRLALVEVPVDATAPDPVELTIEAGATRELHLTVSVPAPTVAPEPTLEPRAIPTEARPNESTPADLAPTDAASR